jgi:hypothetical protein
LLVDFGSFHSCVDNIINNSFNYTVTRHRWNCQELKYIMFCSALALIHVLSHFQRTTCSQNYFRFSSYLLRKTAFICNIDRDWMIYRKHPIRSLLTSMLRKASFRYPSDVYALSFEKYKGILLPLYGEFLKDKNVLFIFILIFFLCLIRMI